MCNICRKCPSQYALELATLLVCRVNSHAPEEYEGDFAEKTFLDC